MMAEDREQQCIDKFCNILLSCCSPVRKEYLETIIINAKHKYGGQL